MLKDYFLSWLIRLFHHSLITKTSMSSSSSSSSFWQPNCCHYFLNFSSLSRKDLTYNFVLATFFFFYHGHLMSSRCHLFNIHFFSNCICLNMAILSHFSPLVIATIFLELNISLWRLDSSSGLRICCLLLVMAHWIIFYLIPCKYLSRLQHHHMCND